MDQGLRSSPQGHPLHQKKHDFVGLCPLACGTVLFLISARQIAVSIPARCCVTLKTIVLAGKRATKMPRPEPMQKSKKIKSKARTPERSACGGRLRALLDEYAITYTAFAELIGISPQRLRNWFMRGLPPAWTERLAQMLSVSEVWLVTGEGDRPAGCYARIEKDPAEATTPPPQNDASTDPPDKS